MYPSPKHLKGVTDEDLGAFLRKPSHNSCSTRKAKEILDIVESDGDTTREYQGSRDFIIQSIVRDIAFKSEEIKKVETEMKKLLKLLDLKLETIPGVDTVTSIALVAHIGDIKRFRNANKLAKFSGIAQTHINNGKWTDVRGESTFISDNVEASNILKEVGRDGVDYSNAIPDFSTVSQGSVKIEGMAIDRRINFKKADELLAEQLGKTTKEIVKMRKINNLTWHELNDMKTMQLVPTLINSKFAHLGGVSEVSKVIK